MDAHKNKLYLTQAEVAELFSMDRTTFRQMAKSRPDFPKPKEMGKNAKGKPILRYLKFEVLAYLIRLQD